MKRRNDMNYKEMLQKAKKPTVTKPSDLLAENIKKFACSEDIQGVPCKEAYDIYCLWCKENGYASGSIWCFGHALKSVYGLKSKNIRIGGISQKVYF